nr:hypothetical protein CFP56_02985 [Quercus suber]
MLFFSLLLRGIPPPSPFPPSFFSVRERGRKRSALFISGHGRRSRREISPFPRLGLRLLLLRLLLLVPVARGRRRVQEFPVEPGTSEPGGDGGARGREGGGVGEAAVAAAGERVGGGVAVAGGADADADAEVAGVEGLAVQVAVAELVDPEVAGLPAGAVARADLLHHAVDLLEGEGFGLGDEEVGEDGAADAQRAPQEEDLHAEPAVPGVDDVGDDDADDAVEEPGGRRRGGSACWKKAAGRERGKDLTNEDDEGDVGGIGIRVGGADGGDDEFADAHGESAVDEKGSAAELLDGVKGNRRAGDVDDGRDHGYQKGPDAHSLEDEVDAGELLEGLQPDADEDLSQVGVPRAHPTPEAFDPGHLAHLLFVFVVGLDLGQLVLDVVGIMRLAAHAGQRFHRLVQPLLLDPVPWRFGQDHQAPGQDDRPDELDRDRDPVRAGILLILCGVTDAGGQHDADGDGELIRGHDGSTDLARRHLAHVQDVGRRDEPDAESRHEPADDEGRNVHDGDLQHDSDDEHGAARDDGRPASEAIGQMTTDECADEGPGGQDRDGQTPLPRRIDVGVVMRIVGHLRI